MTRRAPVRLSAPDFAARYIVLAAGLSLNDVASKTFNISQAASFGIVVGALAIIALTPRPRLSPALMLIALSIVSYVALGAVYSAANGADLFLATEGSRSPLDYIEAYAGSVLILWTIATYVASIPSRDDVEAFLRFCRNVFLFTALAIWLSPYLERFFTAATYTSDFRMRGLFSNPNEAAQAALFSLLLCVLVPPKRRLTRYLLLALTSGAAVITLSKGAIVLAIMIMAYLFVRQRHLARTFLALLSCGIALVALQNAETLFAAVVSQEWIPIPESQQQRILAIGQLLGGRVDADTTTGRTFLWQLSLERIQDQLPEGAGLGTFHHLVGGIAEANVWQGAHNVFLMILGESGPLPLLILLLGLLAATSRSLRLPAELREFSLLCLVFLVIFWMSGHTGLAIRFHDLMLALVVGLGARSWGARPYQRVSQVATR